MLQGLFAGGGMYGQVPSYLTERFPTEIRATATGFCYHVGAIFGGVVPPILTYFAITGNLGFAIPMLIGTMFGLANFILSVAFRAGDPGNRNGARSGRGLSEEHPRAAITGAVLGCPPGAALLRRVSGRQGDRMPLATSATSEATKITL